MSRTSATHPNIQSLREAMDTPGALLVVVSGPSGVGKTTITRALEARVPGAILSISLTTRPRGPSEVEGVDYDYVTEEQFETHARAPGPDGLGDFLEHAGVYGKRYGTLRAPVERGLREGRMVILEIDVQGAVQVRERAPAAFGVFILPPGEEALLARLRSRGRDTEEVIQRRFAAAKREIEQARGSGAYDAFLVNEDLDRTIDEVVRLVEARRRR